MDHRSENCSCWYLFVKSHCILVSRFLLWRSSEEARGLRSKDYTALLKSYFVFVLPLHEFLPVLHGHTWCHGQGFLPLKRTTVRTDVEFVTWRDSRDAKIHRWILRRQTRDIHVTNDNRFFQLMDFPFIFSGRWHFCRLFEMKYSTFYLYFFFYINDKPDGLRDT